jgi:anthranilate phosphoribosyltransferase
MKAVLERLLQGEVLAEADMDGFLAGLLDEAVPDAQKAAALAALRTRGETAAEVRGLATALRRRSLAVPAPRSSPLVDTAGTGGDGSGSFNVSTAAALVVAAAGVRVAKHGNRSVSSRCGSADVIEALGVPLAADPVMARDQLVDLGFTFLFAPTFHAATAAVGAVRRALGVRTIFNLLGPLTNPAGPTHQLVGAGTEADARTLAEALAGLPITAATVVHGSPGWDEATPCGPFLELKVRRDHVEAREVDPLFTYGIARAAPEDLAGGDAVENARKLEEVFSGARSPIRDAVLLNAALALELVGRATDPRDAFALAVDVVDSGRATWFLDRLRRAVVTA